MGVRPGSDRRRLGSRSRIGVRVPGPDVRPAGRRGHFGRGRRWRPMSSGGTGYSLALVMRLSWSPSGGQSPSRHTGRSMSSAPTSSCLSFAGLGTASLVLAHSSAVSPEPSAVDVFLVAVIVADLGSRSIVERMPSIPLVDPFSITAIGAVLGAVVAALIWDLDVVVYLLSVWGSRWRSCRRPRSSPRCCAPGRVVFDRAAPRMAHLSRRRGAGRRHLFPSAGRHPLALRADGSACIEAEAHTDCAQASASTITEMN